MDVVNSTKHLPEEMVQRGKVKLGEKKVTQLLGQGGLWAGSLVTPLRRCMSLGSP
jgi:hypothetical protein